MGHKNTIYYVITWYNDASGIQLSKGACYNTINYWYSYRNYDVTGYGGGADGFVPKLDTKKVIFNHCYAWDNSDEGWDTFDKERDNSDDLSLNHWGTWNNRNVDDFNRKFDYDKGNPLYKNMLTIQQMIESD